MDDGESPMIDQVSVNLSKSTFSCLKKSLI